MTDDDWAWFAASVLGAAAEIRAEDRIRMASQVKGLAETVRQAKQAISRASDVSTKVNASAQQLLDTMSQVEAMTSELDHAHAELQAALGQITNGAPPLETGAPAPASSAAPSVADVADKYISPELNAALPGGLMHRVIG